jgi:hypothetical protein
MSCQNDCKRILNALGMPSFTPQIESVIDFYCGLGFLPEEIAAEINAALSLPTVLEKLKDAGITVDSYLRESVLAQLRKGVGVETIVEQYARKKSPRP